MVFRVILDFFCCCFSKWPDSTAWQSLCLYRTSFPIIFKAWVGFWGWFSMEINRNEYFTLSATHTQLGACLGNFNFIFEVPTKKWPWVLLSLIPVPSSLIALISVMKFCFMPKFLLLSFISIEQISGRLKSRWDSGAAVLPLVPPGIFIQTHGLVSSRRFICLGTFHGRWGMRDLCHVSGRKGF